MAGKTLIPPWVATFGEPEDVSWTDTILPEFLWIGLLHRKHGQIEGAKLALDLARFADETYRCPSGGFYGAISDYAILGDRERRQLLQRVQKSGALPLYLEAFNPLLAHYPFCPLGFLFEGERLEAAPSLDTLSELVRVLFDKSHSTTVFVQSTFIYLAFVLDRLKVVEGLALARLPEVERYPETEISRRIAASVRTAVLSFFGKHPNTTRSQWSVEFWNRGYELTDCL